MVVDLADGVDAEEVSGLDPDVTELKSITHFLQLLKCSRRTISRRTEPIVNFAKCVIFTGNEYEDAAVGVLNAKENMAKEKKQTTATKV